MDHKDLKITNSILIFLFALVAGLYYGATFLIPLTFGALLAALMAPFTHRLEKLKIGRLLSSLISTLVALIIFGGLFYLIFWQLKLFTQDLPQIKDQIESFLKVLQQKLSYSTGITPDEQDEMLKEQSEEIIGSAQKIVAGFLGNIVKTFLEILLVQAYLFLFLIYRDRFSDFIMSYVSPENSERATSVLHKTSKVMHHYLWGRIKVMSILASMYLITFLAFGLKYTILLTVFGAIVTIIPYIGPFLSGVIPVGFMMVFGGTYSEVMIFATIVLIIQLIESYVLEPVIIGSEVQLNPLVVILAIILGGLIWGIAGMILFVPLFSIIKIISDHTTNLKPIGRLISDSDVNEPPGKGIGNKLAGLFKRQAN